MYCCIIQSQIFVFYFSNINLKKFDNNIIFILGTMELLTYLLNQTGDWTLTLKLLSMLHCEFYKKRVILNCKKLIKDI